MRAPLGLLTCLLSLGVATANADNLRYTVLIMSKNAGLQTTSVAADGTRRYTFEYNDRGRGPKVHSTLRLSESGLPVSLQTSGNDYLKAPVSERFSLTQGTAQWKNDSEQGERKLSGNAFYVSMQGVPEELGLLAAALLKAPDQRLTLLPDGEASLRRAAEATATKGSERKKVFAYEIAGLGFTPMTVWLDEKNQYFAALSSWQSRVTHAVDAESYTVVPSYRANGWS